MNAAQPAEAQAPWVAAQCAQLQGFAGHALLLHGPSGLGQLALALALAHAWLCERPTAHEACGQCPACHLLGAHSHPDLHVLMPEEQLLHLGWPLPEKPRAGAQDAKRKPSREIRIEAMRLGLAFCQHTSARARAKVVLVYPAERMNAPSSNALLKTLEEPPGQVRFILATEAAHQLLPTIRSRCVAHPMRRPAPGESRQWLMQHGAASEEAAAVLRAAGERPVDALALLQEPQAARQHARLPAALAQGDAAPLAALAARSSAQAVLALQKICHDLMLLCVGAEPRYFLRDDLPARPPPLARLAAWARALARAARHAGHPFHAGLMVDALCAQAQAVLQSGESPDMHPPGATQSAPAASSRAASSAK